MFGTHSMVIEIINSELHSKIKFENWHISPILSKATTHNSSSSRTFKPGGEFNLHNGYYSLFLYDEEEKKAKLEKTASQILVSSL